MEIRPRIDHWLLAMQSFTLFFYRQWYTTLSVNDHTPINITDGTFWYTFTQIRPEKTNFTVDPLTTESSRIYVLLLPNKVRGRTLVSRVHLAAHQNNTDLHCSHANPYYCIDSPCILFVNNRFSCLSTLGSLSHQSEQNSDKIKLTYHQLHFFSSSKTKFPYHIPVTPWPTWAFQSPHLCQNLSNVDRYATLNTQSNLCLGSKQIFSLHFWPSVIRC